MHSKIDFRPVQNITGHMTYNSPYKYWVAENGQWYVTDKAGRLFTTKRKKNAFRVSSKLFIANQVDSLEFLCSIYSSSTSFFLDHDETQSTVFYKKIHLSSKVHLWAKAQDFGSPLNYDINKKSRIGKNFTNLNEDQEDSSLLRISEKTGNKNATKVWIL